MNIQAKNFKTRHDLEQYISATCGRNHTANQEHKILGKKEELKRLRLSDTTNIWGIKCEMSDETPERFKKNK